MFSIFFWIKKIKVLIFFFLFIFIALYLGLVVGEKTCVQRKWPNHQTPSHQSFCFDQKVPNKLFFKKKWHLWSFFYTFSYFSFQKSNIRKTTKTHTNNNNTPYSSPWIDPCFIPKAERSQPFSFHRFITKMYNLHLWIYHFRSMKRWQDLIEQPWWENPRGLLMIEIICWSILPLNNFKCTKKKKKIKNDMMAILDITTI